MPQVVEESFRTCPTCHRSSVVHTNNCTPNNSIFDCKYGKRNEPHIHYWCCENHWIVQNELVVQMWEN